MATALILSGVLNLVFLVLWLYEVAARDLRGRRR